MGGGFDNVMKKRLTKTAQTLRRDMTKAEKTLWSHMRGSQLGRYKFVRQFPIGNAVADFACRRVKLVIELDGGHHADSETDKARTKMMEAHGYQVIRFWNNEVLDNIEGVLQSILQELQNAQNQ